MGAAQVSIHVGEDVDLTASTHIARTGAPRAWVHIDGYDSAVWGSPVALRRFAAAVVEAADSAERQIHEQVALLAGRAA
jgi:hypothetical protein